MPITIDGSHRVTAINSLLLVLLVVEVVSLCRRSLGVKVFCV
jgi:hypothetical protein